MAMEDCKTNKFYMTIFKVAKFVTMHVQTCTYFGKTGEEHKKKKLQPSRLYTMSVVMKVKIGLTLSFHVCNMT